jgi:hypothetical protein
MKTTTQRTLKFLRGDGLTCAIVERWNPYAHVRQDLFGFADILAMSPQKGIIAVQTTSRAHRADHMKKILDCPFSRMWVESGGKIWLVTWAKTGPRGKRKMWTSFVDDIKLDFFAEKSVTAS